MPTEVSQDPVDTVANLAAELLRNDKPVAIAMAVLVLEPDGQRRWRTNVAYLDACPILTSKELVKEVAGAFLARQEMLG